MAQLKDIICTGVARFLGKVYASEFVGNSTSSTKWENARNINGLSINGEADRVNYGSCSTAAATVEKVVSCTGFALITGAEITVKFTVTNTATNPTLNVNGTGAKAIYYRGSAISAGYLAANRTYTFKYNGTQYELVGDINTDTNTKATQTNTTTDANYRIVLSTNANDTTETNTLRKSVNFTANPSTGAFFAKGYNRIDLTGKTLDVNTLNLSDGNVDIMRYKEKTSGGANNITNIPVAGQSSILDVELIRWASATDYVTKQTFCTNNDKAHEYVRYCTNGTWDTWTKRIFTDNNTVYTHPSYTARTGKPTGNQTPAFGGTATISQITSDASGHVTNATDRTITIPSTLSNGTGTAGLIKTTSTVTSNSGYTACPVISGVPYYKDTNTKPTAISQADYTALGTAVNTNNVIYLVN